MPSASQSDAVLRLPALTLNVYFVAAFDSRSRPAKRASCHESCQEVDEEKLVRCGNVQFYHKLCAVNCMV